MNNVLSLFDGMSCGQLALNRAGIQYNNYYASEINKYAIKVTQANFPKTIQLGNIININGKELPEIDLLIGGGPCQGFSVAGKQLNFNDPRSKLFFEYVRILKECKLKYFLFENVKMKKEYQDIISQHLGVEPVMIDSALVSAQRRKRLYWTNIPNVTQPEDKGILLKDIVHENTDVDRDKSYCIDANYAKGTNLMYYRDKKRRQLIFEDLKEYIVDFNKTLQILDKETKSGKIGYYGMDSQANRIYQIHNKAVTLCGDAGGSAAKKWGNIYLVV